MTQPSSPSTLNSNFFTQQQQQQQQQPTTTTNMATQQVDSKRQQGKQCPSSTFRTGTNTPPELQMQYSNFKNTLHQLAQKIGDIETEAEEHK